MGCGCNNGCGGSGFGGNSCWIIILLLLCCGCGDGGFGGGMDCCWIIILLLLFCCCGNNGGCANAANNNCGCGGCGC